MTLIYIDKGSEICTIPQSTILPFLNHLLHNLTLLILIEHIRICLNKIHTSLNQFWKAIYLSNLFIYFPFTFS